MGSAVTFDQMVDKRTRAWSNPSWWNLWIAVPWIIGTLLLLHWWKVDRDLAGRARTAQGIVVSHEPANHNRYGYTFSVNGQTFRGWETPRKNEPKIGERVVVYYDPLNPNKNALTDFDHLSLEILGPVPMLLFGIGAVALYIWIRRRRLRRVASPIQP